MIHLFDGWHLRPFHDNDLEALARYANNRNVWRTLRDRFPSPYTREDAAAWLCLVQSRERPTQLAIASPEELVGAIGFDQGEDVYRKSAEIGYWLAEPFWGRGIVSQAVIGFVDHVFAHFDLVRLQAGVFEGNPASVKILEKAGFRFEGRRHHAVYKDGRLLDELMYGRVRED